MSIIHAIVLGIVQGIAEFLLVSSSAHLIVVPWLFGWEDFQGEESLLKAFHVALHIGTLFGAVAYFQKDLRTYIRAGLLDHRSTNGRLAWFIALSAIPAGLAGALFSSQIESGLSDQFVVIALALILGGVGLGWADGTLGQRKLADLQVKDVVYLSVAQVFALIPGLSRAGTTVTVGRLVGMERDDATRFAFLMSIPVIAGAVVYKYIDIGGWGAVPSNMRPAFMVGVVVSGVVGFFVIRGLLHFVRTRSFFIFVVYRIVLGLAILGVVALGLR